MEKIEYKIMPYKHGDWCVGRKETQYVEVTCKDSKQPEFLESHISKTIVFRGTLQSCEVYLRDKQ